MNKVNLLAPKDKRIEIYYRLEYRKFFTPGSIVVQLEYTSNKQTSKFWDILGSFGYEMDIKNLKKFTKLTNFMFYVKNCKT